MQKVIYGRDMSRDWLATHCLPDGQRHRMPNTDDGHRSVRPRSQAGGRDSAARRPAGRSGGSGQLWTALASRHARYRAARSVKGYRTGPSVPTIVRPFPRSVVTRIWLPFTSTRWQSVPVSCVPTLTLRHW